MPKARKKTRRSTIRKDRQGIERIAVSLFIPLKHEQKLLRKVGIMRRAASQKPCNSLKAVCEELLERALR